MRWMAPSGLVGLLAILTACSPTVGTACDEALARRIVYDPGGHPAYEGQSILITSCAGGGSFCHSSSASRRYGAPFDLNFDPTLADSPVFADEVTGAAHLYAAQVASDHFRNEIFGQVSSGAMPPGALGEQVMPPRPYRLYVDAADSVGVPVPSIRSADGREVLRNWLACGSPVVEATSYPLATPCSSNADCTLTHRCDTSHQPHAECFDVGAIISVRQVTTPNWNSIYSTVLEPTCALSVCHGMEGAALSGQLDLSTPALAYTALVGAPASTAGCGTRVIARDAAGSYLVEKLEGRQSALCGATMPLAGMLSADTIAIIRTWITNGAMMD